MISRAELRRSHVQTPSTSRPSTPTLQVESLSIRYRDADGQVVRILDDLTFEVFPEQFVCLVGRSGSGKTSVLRNVVGLTQPSSGVIAWDGEDIANWSDDARADLRRTAAAYLDQKAGLVAELTLLENALVAQIPAGRAAVRACRSTAKQLLTELGLSARFSWRPEQASGGERQRVALARALLSEAPTLVADEPTASLDRRWADCVIAKLRAHADQGGSVLAASHDSALADAADVVIELTEA